MINKKTEKKNNKILEQLVKLKQTFLKYFLKVNTIAHNCNMQALFNKSFTTTKLTDRLMRLPPHATAYTFLKWKEALLIKGGREFGYADRVFIEGDKRTPENLPFNPDTDARLGIWCNNKIVLKKEVLFLLNLFSSENSSGLNTKIDRHP